MDIWRTGGHTFLAYLSYFSANYRTSSQQTDYMKKTKCCQGMIQTVILSIICYFFAKIKVLQAFTINEPQKLSTASERSRTHLCALHWVRQHWMHFFNFTLCRNKTQPRQHAYSFLQVLWLLNFKKIVLLYKIELVFLIHLTLKLHKTTIAAVSLFFLTTLR